MATPEGRKKWREDILSGVKTISKFGVPGLVVVSGVNAEPIVTGNTARDVLVAAAELGEGRVVVFSHDGYTKSWFLKDEISENDQTFRSNILSWVTKGKYTKKWTMVQMAKRSIREASPMGTVLVWHAPEPREVESVEDLTGFVKKGGSLIIGVTPWGSMQIYRCEVNGISCNKFLREIGIFLSDGYINISETKIKVANNKAETAHVGVLLQKCTACDMKISELNPEIIGELGAIPDEDCQALIKEHICGADIMNICRSPNPKKPIRTDKERAAALFANLVFKKAEMTAPGVKEFPGEFDSPPPTSSIEYRIKSHCDEAHPVGAYLAPGGTAVIQILDGKPHGWKVQVGCHSDNLRANDQFKRWPDIVVQKKLQIEGETKIHSPFGGSIYFLSPKGNLSLTVRMKAVVASPLFCLDDKPEDWNKNRTKPGLWADLVGKHIRLTVPSETIRGLDNPFEAMQFWDEVVTAHHDLKGVSLDAKRREWIVPDIQPSAGYMHSGYPVVTHMDAADPKQKMFIVKKPGCVVDGHWGYFHELGHNMQDDLWTFQGTVEVTCNIFSLHGMEKLFNIPAWKHEWLEGNKEAMKKYLRNGAKFEDWKKHPGVALGIYAQLARDFGWDAYKKVFRQYEKERPILKTDKEKIDHWVRSFSKVAEANLVPAFKLWGIPVSEAVAKELAGYKEYLPNDEVTEVIRQNSS